MTADAERAALIALLGYGKRPWQEYAHVVEEVGAASAVLEDELGLLAGEAVEHAAAQIASWHDQGIRLETILDSGYPANLRAVHDRPPVIFVDGELNPGRDQRAVAVVGARQATPAGIGAAKSIAAHLVDRGYVVISGLAAGIDTAAHSAALASGGRTIAVIGTGVRRTYPPQSARLQQRIARECAVVSQFWPEAPPSKRTFPLRNGVISGLSLASVIVEASHTSGSRIQARLALGHGRPVLLVRSLLQQQWARELARKPGVHVVKSPEEIGDLLERLTAPTALTV
jgi:DNA processing protein